MLKPPTYHEAIGQVIVEPPGDEYVEEDYPPPEFSTIDRSQRHDSSAPNANGEDIRPVNHSHSMSYSSESSTEIPLGRNVSNVHSPNYTEIPHRRVRISHREERENEYTERSSSRDDRPEDRRNCPPPRRPKSNIRQELERKLQEDQINPANIRRNLNSDKPGQMSEDKRNTNYRERQSFPDSPSRHGSSSLHPKAAESNKDEHHWKEENKRSKGDLRNRASDSSSKGLLFSEDHNTEGENRGILNQAFKDFERNSQHSPPRTNSASLANLPNSLDKWTDDRRGGMAMSLQHLPTTHCVASNNIQAARSAQDLQHRRSTANHPIANIGQHLQPSDRPMSLSVGNLPNRSQEQPLNTGENRRERERPAGDPQRSVSLGDLNRRLNSQTARRQTHSHADLSNIQEERGADSIVFACESEDVFV